GVRIDGIEVGGKTPRQAQRALEARARALAAVPVSFRVGSHVWRLEPRRLGIRVDWDAAVDAVRRQGEGFGPLRGFRRLDMRFFGADVAPPTQVYDAALRYWLDRIERTVDTPHRDASIVLHGLTPQIVSSRRGLELPADGRRDLRIGGNGASNWFTALSRRVDRPPTDADWAISSTGSVRVIPDRPGYNLDVPRSATAVLHAALVTEPTLRSAKLA